jgi:phospholipase C
VNNPSQNWDASHEQWNNGKMDGFVKSPSGVGAMGYWDGTHLPFYYSLAKTFPLCDRWFCSVMAQTYPNRRFLLAGTARGDIRTDILTISDPLPPNGLITDSLNRNSISWADYYTSVPSMGIFLKAASANTDKLKTLEDHFYADAAAGKLPAFSIVDPDFDHQSEENPQDISVGEAFAARVINAVMQSPNWPKTMLMFCYDEHGGYYDHVPPPLAPEPDGKGPDLQPGDVPGAYNRLGFRVPAVIVSPYARRNYVSHVVHDHTSVLALVEHKFNLPALTHRDGWADDLLDSVDLTGTPAFLTPPTLAAPLNHTARNAEGIAQDICTFPSPIPAGV